MLKYSWKFSKPYVVSVFLLQLVSSILPLAGIVLPKYIIDELLGYRRPQQMIVLIAILTGCNLVAGLLMSYFRGKSFTSKNVVFCKFQTMIAEKLALCDFEQLENPEFLDIKERAGKFLYANGQGFGVVLDSAVNILGKFITFIGIIAIILTLNVWIVLVFIALVFLNALVDFYVKKNYVKWDMEKAPIERKTGYFIRLVEDFSFGKEIRLFNLRSWIVQKISNHLNIANEFYGKQTTEYNKSYYFNSLTGFIREAFSYGYLSFRVIYGFIGVGDFTMYISAIAQFSSAMNDVMQSILNIKQFGSYYDALEKYMNIPTTMRSGKTKLDKSNSGEYVIKFDNVSFKYAGSSHFALRNINITIYGKEKITIVGENGAGKSTFVKLLCRLYKPTEGTIFLNGIDIQEIEYDSYMSMIAPVFQDYKLFSFSVKENIAFSASNHVADERIINLLESSGFGGKLANLENGIHTHIYKNFELDGFEPSGGEGQKLSIARALYKDAPIVVLDEPTAALDPRAEFEIYQKFHSLTLGRSAIYVSHRLAISKLCDNVAVFSNGEMIEYGSHHELLSRKGLYYELYSMQAQFYTES
ncbi:MAG: ABC transporter ATP-binding protein/permease [Clostridium sp.]|nr:ABC transporter ATP-binding protein/permease [Clostridium sp.]